MNLGFRVNSVSHRVKSDDFELVKDNSKYDILTKARVKVLLKDFVVKIEKSIRDNTLVKGKNILVDFEMNDKEYFISIILNEYIYSISFRFTDGLLNRVLIDNKDIEFIDYNSVNIKMYDFFTMIDKKISVLRFEGAKNQFDKYKIL